MSFQEFQLSGGICNWLYYNEVSEEQWPPPHIPQPCIIQFLSVKQAADPPMFRLTVSDGANIIQAMLRDTLNHLVDSGRVRKGAVVSLGRVSSDIIRGKRLVVIQAINSVFTSNAEKIGDPAFLPAPSSVASGIARDAAMAGSNIPPELTPARTRPFEPQPGPSWGTQSNASTSTLISATASGSQSSTQPSESPEIATVPIASLNSYSSNWTIKATVISKSDLITARSTLFFVELTDDQSQTRMKAMVVDRVNELHGSIQNGQVYYISGAKVKEQEEKYRSRSQHKFMLTFNRDTRLELCADAPPPPPLTYNFTPIASLPQLSVGSTCDIIGILYERGPVKEQVSSKGKFKLRELTIVDKSRTSVRITLFRTMAEKFEAEEEEVIAFKGLEVQEFQGVTLQLISSSSMVIHPDLKEAFDLRGWYDSVSSQTFHPCSGSGSGMRSAGNSPQKQKQKQKQNQSQNQNDANTDTESSSGNGSVFPARPLTIRNVLDENKMTRFSTQATVVYINPGRVTYPGCPSCMKKVERRTDGWACAGGHSSAEPNYRYLMYIKVADQSGETELQAFDNVGQTLLQTSANDLEHYRHAHTPDSLQRFQSILQAVLSKEFTFECRVEKFQGRNKYVIDKAVPVDYEDEVEQLLSVLKSDWAK